MIYIEMSRDETHGGGTWGFTNCVWAPSEKRGGGSWPFWTKVRDIRQGDTVIHLRGQTPNAFFVGYSTSSGDGFETNRRPPAPKDWDYANSFYRADLSQFTPFHQPVNLKQLFHTRQRELTTYFDTNRGRGSDKLNIFFVRQAGRLQCLNGAYLSDADEELMVALFGTGEELKTAIKGEEFVIVQTGSQIAHLRTRLGQSRFSAAVKKMYGNRCCFPGCNMTDSRFLVGAHIARWSDNESLRGNMGNGLCMCLQHDRAFEIGLFTLDENFQVYVNQRELNSSSPVIQQLVAHQGMQISLADVRPMDEALLEHWIRVDINP